MKHIVSVSGDTIFDQITSSSAYYDKNIRAYRGSHWQLLLVKTYDFFAQLFSKLKFALAHANTCAEQVVDDIKNQLKLKEPVLMFKTPCFRENLYYDVCFEDTIQNSFNHLKRFINDCLGDDEEDVPLVSFAFMFITDDISRPMQWKCWLTFHALQLSCVLLSIWWIWTCTFYWPFPAEVYQSNVQNSLLGNLFYKEILYPWIECVHLQVGCTWGWSVLYKFRVWDLFLFYFLGIDDYP